MDAYTSLLAWAGAWSAALKRFAEAASPFFPFSNLSAPAATAVTVAACLFPLRWHLDTHEVWDRDTTVDSMRWVSERVADFFP